jgi:hypothetical protein
VKPDAKLYAALTAGSPTSAIVDLVGTRIYPTRIPAGVGIPAIAYQRVGTEYDRTISSNVHLPVASTATFDVFCVAVDYVSAEALGDLVEALNSHEIIVINRSATIAGDEEDAPYAAILTFVVDV